MACFPFFVRFYECFSLTPKYLLIPRSYHIILKYNKRTCEVRNRYFAPTWTTKLIIWMQMCIDASLHCCKFASGRPRQIANLHRWAGELCKCHELTCVGRVVVNRLWLVCHPPTFDGVSTNASVQHFSAARQMFLITFHVRLRPCISVDRQFMAFVALLVPALLSPPNYLHSSTVASRCFKKHTKNFWAASGRAAAGWAMATFCLYIYIYISVHIYIYI